MKRVMTVGIVALSLNGASVAAAVDVCTYRVTASIGAPCPVSRGSQVCLSESTAIGPCDAALRCVGGPGYFCQATLEPLRGPERSCPFGSVRPRGFRCHQPITPGQASTPTETPVAPETPTFTPTATAIPTGTASATVTATQTVASTATETAPSTPTDTATALATATVTATPTGTAAAIIGGTIARRPFRF